MMILRFLPKAFATPTGLCLVLLLLALILSRRPRLSKLLCAAAALILFTLSTPRIAEALMATLEQQYASPSMANIPQVPAIVVAGGALRLPGGNHLETELTDSSDRLRCAMQLYRAGKAPLLVITGGITPGRESISESRAARNILVEWGVPESAILIEEASRATNENATNTWALLQQRGIGRAILVTSASHMPRAVASFRKVGLVVVPVPSDFHTGFERPRSLMDFAPSPDSFALSSRAIQEWIGFRFYRIMGWA